jgi:hypothetical protein
MAKTPDEIAAEEDATRAHREQLAREANEKRNQAMLDKRNAIADQADRQKEDEDELVELTDEVWSQEDRPEDKRPKTRAEKIAEQEAREAEEEGEVSEDEAAARLIRAKEAEDREADEARDAGADDVRKNEDGVTEYRVKVNGKEKWLSLAELRATAQKVDSADEYLQEAKRGAKTAPTQPSPDQVRQREEAEARAREAHEMRKAQLKDLYTRASMGDDEAIEKLAEIQAGLSGVTPDVLRIVDERVDARVQGRTAFQKAVDWFESDDGYATELAAPGFKAKAAQIDARLAQEHPEWSPRERLEQTGEELRRELKQLQQFFGGAKPRTQQREPTKDERKRSAPRPPDMASGRVRSDVEPDEAESTQEAIKALARSRGQQRPVSYNR